MGAPKKPAGKVELWIRDKVLGPKEGRGTEPQDPRELTEDVEEQQKRSGGER